MPCSFDQIPPYRSVNLTCSCPESALSKSQTLEKLVMHEMLILILFVGSHGA